MIFNQWSFRYHITSRPCIIVKTRIARFTIQRYSIIIYVNITVAFQWSYINTRSFLADSIWECHSTNWKIILIGDITCIFRPGFTQRITVTHFRRINTSPCQATFTCWELTWRFCYGWHITPVTSLPSRVW